MRDHLQKSRQKSRSGLEMIARGALLCIALLCALPGARAQEAGDAAMRELLARLATGDEEMRMDAAARLSTWFDSATGRTVDPELVPALTRSLQRDLSPLVRALAARALGICGDPRVLAPLHGALGKEREVAVRKAILYALARYPFDPAAQTASSLLPILPLLDDKKAELRGAAAFALAEIGDPAAAPHLLAFLRKRRKDEDAFGRTHAVRALGRAGSREAIAPLAAALSKDHSQEVRREAAFALGLFAAAGDAPAAEALRKALTDQDPYLVRAAAEALERIRLRAASR